MNQRQERGRKGERQAADYLQKKGYRILERNLSSRLGEIDLVAETDETIIFIEVKTGQNDPDFPPSIHFDRQKERKLWQLGKRYLANLPESRNARFDLITVIDKPSGTSIDHYENVLTGNDL